MSFLNRIRATLAEWRRKQMTKTLFEQAFPNNSDLSPQDRAVLGVLFLEKETPERSGYTIRYVDIEWLLESKSLAQFDESIYIKGGEHLEETLELGMKDYSDRTGKPPYYLEISNFYQVGGGWHYKHPTLETRYSAFLSAGEFIVGS